MKFFLHLAKLVVLSGVPGISFAFDCPEMPASAGINQNVKSEIEASIGKIAGLRAGELSIKTEVTAKNLYEKYPKIEQLTIAQAMYATYCSMLRYSKISDIEKLDRWERFQSNVLKFTPPLPNGDNNTDSDDSDNHKKKSSDYLLKIKFGEKFSNLPDYVTVVNKENNQQAIHYYQQLFGIRFKIIQNLNNDFTSTAKASSISSGERNADLTEYMGEGAQNVWDRCDIDRFYSYATQISKELGAPKAMVPNHESLKRVRKDFDLEANDRSAYWNLSDKSKLLLHLKHYNYIQIYPSGGKSDRKWVCKIELCAMHSPLEEPCFEMDGIKMDH